MLVDAHRGQKPLSATTVSIAQVCERARLSHRRLSYQALLGRKNPLSSKGSAAD